MADNHSSRRNFIRNTSLASAALLSIPQIVSAAYRGQEVRKKKIKIRSDDVILFQGDSITDAGRKKKDTSFNTAGEMGSGYAMIAAAELLFKYADMNVKIYNRGISGNKVYQLAERWDADCLDLKPNVLSILIGVNDFWHKHLGRYDGTIDTYRNDFRKLLDRTMQRLPDVKLVIGEPYAVNGVKAVDDSWFPDFNEYRAAAKDIAESYDAVFIPYQSVFEKAEKQAPGSYWTLDGVHPSLAGAQLMAHAWMEAVK